MDVTARVMGGDTHHLDLEDATSGDVLRAIGLSPQEATVFVDGRPIPEDQPLEHAEVNVVRLISGG